MTNYSINTVAADGTTRVFVVPFPYLKETDVYVTVGGAAVTGFTWPTSSTIQLAQTAISLAGKNVVIYRQTNRSTPETVFQSGGLDPSSLNDQVLQLLYIAQENMDATGGCIRAFEATVAPLPDAATRIGTVMGFDGLGNPTVFPTSAFANPASIPSDVVSLSSFLSAAQLADVAARTLLVDCTVAINQFLASIIPGKKYYIPSGFYRFSATLVAPGGVNFWTLFGAGRYLSQFVYFGATTTCDLFQAGTTSTSTSYADTLGVNIGGFMVRSNTVMTSPSRAIHLSNMFRTTVFDISNGGMNNAPAFGTYPQNTWNGIFFDGVNEVWMDGFEFSSQWDGIEARGTSQNACADLTITRGYSNFNGRSGVHVSGGLGGFFADFTELMGNTTYNMMLTNYNQSPNAVGNREILLGVSLVCDGIDVTTQDSLLVDDSTSSGMIVDCHAMIGSALQHGVHIKSMPSGTFTYAGGMLENNQNCGLMCDDATTLVTLGAGLMVRYNFSYGVYASVTTSNFDIHCNFANNAGGAIGGYVNTWKTWPLSTVAAAGSGLVASSSGTMASASGTLRYKFEGKQVHFQGTILVSGPGGAYVVTVGMPFSALNLQIAGMGRETVQGKALQTIINNATVSLVNVDNTYPVNASGTSALTFGGTAELAYRPTI